MSSDPLARAIQTLAQHAVDALQEANLQPIINNAYAGYMNGRAAEQLAKQEKKHEGDLHFQQALQASLLQRWKEQVAEVEADRDAYRTERDELQQRVAFMENHIRKMARPSLWSRFNHWRRTR